MRPRKIVPLSLLFCGILVLPAAAQVAQDDSYSLERGTVLSAPAPGVLGNDCCLKEPQAASLMVAPTSGDVSLAADGSFTYTHDGSATTSDSFQYQVDFTDRSFEIATVFLTITAPSTSGPTALDDEHSVQFGGTLTVAAPGVLGNDTDPAGNPLTAVLVTPPAFASAFSLAPDGSFSYTHDGVSSELMDSFSYQASDGTLLSNLASVVISISDPSAPAPGGGGLLSVLFSQVEQVSLSTDAGSGTVQLELGAGAGAPATVQGDGMPLTTANLVVSATEVGQAPQRALLAQLSACRQAADLALARPGLFTVRVTLQPFATSEGSTERIFVTGAQASTVECTLNRVP